MLFSGNSLLHKITSREAMELRIDLSDFEGRAVFAEYTSFSVADEQSKFRLSVAGYSGTAGNNGTLSAQGIIS